MANGEITLNDILNASFCEANGMRFNQEPETNYMQELKQAAANTANAIKTKSSAYYNRIKKFIGEIEYNPRNISEDIRERELQKYYALIRD